MECSVRRVTRKSKKKKSKCTSLLKSITEQKEDDPSLDVSKIPTKEADPPPYAPPKQTENKNARLSYFEGVTPSDISSEIQQMEFPQKEKSLMPQSGLLQKEQSPMSATNLLQKEQSPMSATDLLQKEQSQLPMPQSGLLQREQAPMPQTGLLQKEQIAIPQDKLLQKEQPPMSQTRLLQKEQIAIPQDQLLQKDQPYMSQSGLLRKDQPYMSQTGLSRKVYPQIFCANLENRPSQMDESKFVSPFAQNSTDQQVEMSNLKLVTQPMQNTSYEQVPPIQNPLYVQASSIQNRSYKQLFPMQQYQSQFEQSPSTFLKQQNVTTIIFQPGHIGMNFKGNTVTYVDPNSQAQLAGAQVGWRVMSVNNIQVPPDTNYIITAIKNLSNTGQLIPITFQFLSLVPVLTEPVLTEPVLTEPVLTEPVLAETVRSETVPSIVPVLKEPLLAIPVKFREQPQMTTPVLATTQPQITTPVAVTAQISETFSEPPEPFIPVPVSSPKRRVERKKSLIQKLMGGVF